METDLLPAAGKPILNTSGFSMHSGGHGTVSADWDVALAFMKQYF